MADTPPSPSPPPPPPPGAVPLGVSPTAPAAKGPIGPVGTWFSESFRLSVDRAGHFLPLIVLFSLSVGLVTAFAVWFGLQDSSMTIDAENGTTEWSYGGSPVWLGVAALTVPVSVVFTAISKAAMVRQAWAAQTGAPEQWSESLQGALARAARIIPVSLGRSIIYLLSTALFVGLAAAVPAVTILAPLLVIWLLGVWVALAFIGQTAALSGPEHGAYATSLRLARLQLGPLVGRLLLLALVGAGLIIAAGFVGAPFTAIAGGGAGSAIEFGAESVKSEDVFGPNVMIFALGSVFSAIGLGANNGLTAVGTTLLYRNLGGPVGEDEPGRDRRGGLAANTDQ